MAEPVPELITEAFEAAAGQLLSDHRAAWQLELETLRLERRAILADLRADVLEAVAAVRAAHVAKPTARAAK